MPTQDLRRFVDDLWENMATVGEWGEEELPHLSKMVWGRPTPEPLVEPTVLARARQHLQHRKPRSSPRIWAFLLRPAVGAQGIS